MYLLYRLIFFVLVVGLSIGSGTSSPFKDGIIACHRMNFLSAVNDDPRLLEDFPKYCAYLQDASFEEKKGYLPWLKENNNERYQNFLGQQDAQRNVQQKGSTSLEDKAVCHENKPVTYPNPSFQKIEEPGSYIWDGKHFIASKYDGAVKVKTSPRYLGQTNGQVFEMRKPNMYVLTRRGELILDPENFQNTPQKNSFLSFHPNFQGIEPVACAGLIMITNGKIIEIDNVSGHYIPAGICLQRAVDFFQEKDLLAPNCRVTFKNERISPPETMVLPYISFLKLPEDTTLERLREDLKRYCAVRHLLFSEKVQLNSDMKMRNEALEKAGTMDTLRVLLDVGLGAKSTHDPNLKKQVLDNNDEKELFQAAREGGWQMDADLARIVSPACVEELAKDFWEEKNQEVRKAVTLSSLLSAVIHTTKRAQGKVGEYRAC